MNNEILHSIRESLNQELVLGNNRFKDEIETMLKRQARPRKTYRPKQSQESILGKTVAKFHSFTLISEEERATSQATRTAWAKLIYQVYEADPLICSRCGNAMRMIAVINDSSIVRQILEHLKLWHSRPVERAPPNKGGGPIGRQTSRSLQPTTPYP